MYISRQSRKHLKTVVWTSPKNSASGLNSFHNYPGCKKISSLLLALRTVGSVQDFVVDKKMDPKALGLGGQRLGCLGGPEDGTGQK